ncbi:hypothetical protein NMG60_11015224 [Bertholletia excelsa]
MSVEKDPSKSHAVGFCVSMSPDAYGWNNNPVYIIARRGKDNPRFVYRKVYLGKQGPNKNLYFGKHEPNKEFFLPADPDAYESLVVEAATGPLTLALLILIKFTSDFMNFGLAGGKVV